MASADSKLNQKTQIRRGGRAVVTVTNRNANARNILANRTGRGVGGGFTRGQLREALANQNARTGTSNGGRRRRL
jgi:hypothetical protein